MIKITDGFTSIRAGADLIPPPRAARPMTGARVTLEFCREQPLVPGQAVEACYKFVDGGEIRTATGIATPTRVVVRSGSVVAFHYRLTHWIEPRAVMRPATHASVSG